MNFLSHNRKKSSLMLHTGQKVFLSIHAQSVWAEIEGALWFVQG